MRATTVITLITIMSKSLPRIFSNPFLLVLLTVLIKIPVFFTKHIQEDSFITWRVAKNLLNYGVVGFNGEERLSASTTHLYVLVSAFFQLNFGDYFIYPLLNFNCILFGIGSFWLGKVLFRKDVINRGLFLILLNTVPPALTASCLGMEYGILFFLYSGLIYFGIRKGKNWAYLIFPVLLLWTRIDTVIFLGVFFIADVIIRKKLNLVFILGGIIGVVSVVSFNVIYFGEFVNHTISAKKIAYKNLTQNNSLEFLLYQWAYYGGLIKKYSLFTFLIFMGFLAALAYAVKQIIKDKTKTQFSIKVILLTMLAFALLKITVFAFMRAYFDWYYWLPRVFLFIIVLYYVLLYIPLRRKFLVPAVFICCLGLYGFQILQSWAIGYMEETQRMQIARDIQTENPNIDQSILLEPAGKIPFYTDLYTYDEVGLVNKKITAQIQKDEKHWWMNSVKGFRPDYIVTIIYKPGDEKSYYKMTASDHIYFDSHYQFVKSYPIAEIHRNAPAILRWIYSIRPIGQDYHLHHLRK